MLEQICAHIHNFFDMDAHRNYWHKESGLFSITGGTISLDFLQTGQYFRIEDSVFNDGVYQYPPTGLTNEVFDGTIYAMHVPKSFLALCSEIAAWQTANGAAAMGPYQSESFGGYSYTLANRGQGSNGLGAGWQLSFKDRLDPWRKIG